MPERLDVEPSPPTATSRRGRPYLAAICLAVIYLTSVGFHYRAMRHEAEFPLLATDEAQYIAVGENLRLGRGFTIRGEFDNSLPPIYPLFVAFSHSWGANVRMSALVWSSIVVSLALFPVYGLARFIGLNETLACLAAAAAAFLPNTVLAGLYMTETVSYPLFLTTFLATARWLEAPSIRRASIAGVLLALMLLTKMAALSFAAAVIVAVVILTLLPRRGRRHFVRPGYSAFVVLAIVAATQLLWQIFKLRHGSAGLGIYGRAIGPNGLEHLSLSVLATYVSDFLLAPGLIVVMPLLWWFRNEGRERVALSVLLGSTLSLQIGIHSMLEGGLGGLLQERLYIYSMPLIATFALAGLASFDRAPRSVKALTIIAPLVLLAAVSRYSFPYIPVMDIPWVAAMGTPGVADVLHFDRVRAMISASVLIALMSALLLPLGPRRAQLAMAVFIVAFNVFGIVSSTKKMSVLSTMGRVPTRRVLDWLSANQLRANDTLVIAGPLASFQERHRKLPVDAFFVEWQRRFGLTVIANLQLEAVGRFDVRMAPSPDEIASLLAGGGRLLTATRMTGLTLVGYQYPLYLYAAAPGSSEPVRPLFSVDLTDDLAYAWPYGQPPERQAHMMIAQPIDLPAGRYRAVLNVSAPPSSRLASEFVRPTTGDRLGGSAGNPAEIGSFEFVTPGDSPVQLRVVGRDWRQASFTSGRIEFTAPYREAVAFNNPTGAPMRSSSPLGGSKRTGPTLVQDETLYPECELRSFNDDALAPVHVVDRASAMELRGWSYLVPSSATLQVELRSETQSYALPTEQSQPTASAVSFHVKVPTAAIEPDTYRIHLTRRTGEYSDTCANFWTVTIADPAPAGAIGR